MLKRKLLVEGVQDKDFFASMLNQHGFRDVDVWPPREFDPTSGNGWTNVLKQIPMLVGQMLQADGIDGLGIVIDADHHSSQGGFPVRHAAINNVLAKLNYFETESPPCRRGGIYEHPDGLPDIGVWLMPNHELDGMLENFAGTIITGQEQVQLLSHVDSALQQLPVKLFRQDLDSEKARISTWRAWQKHPGGSLGQCIRDKALDMQHPLAQDFIDWLHKVFPLK